MASRNSGRTVRVGRAPRRKLVWARTFNSGQTHTPGVTSTNINPLAFFESSYGANPIGITIMAIRGNVMWTIDNSATAGERAMFRYGIRVKNDADTTAGDLFAAPGGSDADWMMWDGGALHTVNGAATGTAGEGGVYRAAINNRSRRRIDELGDTLVLSSQVANASVTPAVFFYDLSILIALP